MVVAMVVVVTCTATIGCGDRGPRRYRVSGSVTFAGEPVRAGRIVFEPDVGRGNSGPQGFAFIREGRFDTSDRHAKGVVGGPTLVMIDGIKVVEGVDAPIAGRLLFPTHEERIDLPLANVTRDFSVPAAAAP